MQGAKMDRGSVVGTSFVDRMIGAARLNRPTYEEVEHDTSATTQAAIIVVVAAVLTGIGALGEGWVGLIGAVIGAILGWVVASAFIYLVGTRLIPSSTVEADLGQVLRTQGFADVPAFLLVLGFIPVLGAIVSLVVFIWTIVTRIIGIQSALEASVGRAIGIAIIAFILDVIVLGIVYAIFGINVPGT